MSEPAPRPAPIRLILVDDNVGFQAALAAYLAAYRDLSLEAQAGSAQDVLVLPAALDPDIVILDIHLPDRFGLDLITLLLEKWPRAK